MSLLVTLGMGAGGGGGGGAFVLNSITPAHKQLTLNMSNTPTISGPAADPASYTLTSATGKASTVLSVTAVGNTLVLATTEQTNGQVYTLHIPFIGLVDISATDFDGPFSPSFIAVGIAPVIQIVRSVDTRKIDVVFSEAMRSDDATTPANYSISPPLEIKSIEMLTDYMYRLHTSKQTVGQVYTITASNIRDLANNPIV